MFVVQKSSLLGVGDDLTSLDPSVDPTDHYAHRKDDAQQQSIKTTLMGWKQAMIVASQQWKHISKWFFYANVIANAASNPYFQTMVDSIT